MKYKLYIRRRKLEREKRKLKPFDIIKLLNPAPAAPHSGPEPEQGNEPGRVDGDVAPQVRRGRDPAGVAPLGGAGQAHGLRPSAQHHEAL